MSRIRVIPVLLLKNRGLYKTTRFKNPVYVGDPVNTVRIFNEKEADELAILDFNASRDNTAIDFKKVTEIAGEAFMPMSYGGGIKNLEDAKKIFDAGFEKVILNSILFANPRLIKEIGDIYGAQAVIGGIDIRKNLMGKYKVFSHSGTKSTGYTPEEWASKLEAFGVGEILLNVIDRDGTWGGYDLAPISSLAPSVSVPLIVCGGATGLSDFSLAVKAGASALAAGNLFVYQRPHNAVLISYPTAQEIKKIRE